MNCFISNFLVKTIELFTFYDDVQHNLSLNSLKTILNCLRKMAFCYIFFKSADYHLLLIYLKMYCFQCKVATDKRMKYHIWSYPRSLLGPLTFNLYKAAYYLCLGKKGIIRMFADDSLFYLIQSCYQESLFLSFVSSGSLKCFSVQKKTKNKNIYSIFTLE